MNNQEYVAQSLKESLDNLQTAITAVEDGNDARFEAQIAFVYRKINLAFNTRKISAEQLKNDTDLSFEERCKFPLDFEEYVAGL